VETFPPHIALKTNNQYYDMYKNGDLKLNTINKKFNINFEEVDPDDIHENGQASELRVTNYKST
jgi:hypothetical protein